MLRYPVELLTIAGRPTRALASLRLALQATVLVMVLCLGAFGLRPGAAGAIALWRFERLAALMRFASGPAFSGTVN